MMKGWIGWNHNRLWGFHPAVTTGNDRNLGQKLADGMKKVLATFTALFLVLVIISIWMLYNSHLSGRHSFDPYPWILLNLMLSCFAALQCFILLIANKRGEQIAAEIAQHTYENTQSDTELIRENTEITKLVKTNTDLLDEIHLHVANIGKKIGAEMGNFPPSTAQVDGQART